jgi:DNA polymerase-3 subunit epsilon
MKIPDEVVKIHGITNRHVKNKPIFSQIASKIHKFLSGSDLAGFNILGFDLPFLDCEFERTSVQFDTSGREIIDAMEIFHAWKSGRLVDAYWWYTGRELRNAHSASADCGACWEILQAQVHHHLITPPTVGGIAKYCMSIRDSFMDSGRWFKLQEGKSVFARGKHRGRSLETVAHEDPTYIDWMEGLPDLRADTRRMLKKAVR